MKRSNVSIVADSNEFAGVNAYPEYNALWHLEKTKVVDDLDSFTSAPWEAAENTAKVVKVALIDTAVAWENPCLTDAIDHALMIDFAVEAEGAYPIVHDRLSPEDQAVRDAEQAKFLARASTNRHEGGAHCATSPAFAAHGTAMAGLIGARPPWTGVSVHRPSNLDGSVAHSEPVDLPYVGVDPFCRIIPISISQAPEPDMLANAFKYAKDIGADVVVMATALVPDTTIVPVMDSVQEVLTPEWQVLEGAILDVAKGAYVVCAAGNTGTKKLAYPARLSLPDNKIFSVGAMAEDGTVVSYSAKNADIYLPSGDDLRLDENAFRVDIYAHNKTDLPVRPAHVPLQEASYAELISTDVPGPFGYNPSNFAYVPDGTHAHLDLASLFCEFSGTSGAAAVAGGLFALALEQKSTIGFVKTASPPTPTLLTFDQL